MRETTVGAHSCVINPRPKDAQAGRDLPGGSSEFTVDMSPGWRPPLGAVDAREGGGLKPPPSSRGHPEPQAVQPFSTASSPTTIPMRPPAATRQVLVVPRPFCGVRRVASSGLS